MAAGKRSIFPTPTRESGSAYATLFLPAGIAKLLNFSGFAASLAAKGLHVAELDKLLYIHRATDRDVEIGHEAVGQGINPTMH